MAKQRSATPLEALAEAIAAVKAAPLLHKGERSTPALDVLLEVLTDQDQRLGAIEAQLQAIIHPARVAGRKPKSAATTPPPPAGS